MRIRFPDIFKKNRTKFNFKPGHFYSPIPSITDVQRDESRIYGAVPGRLPGVNLNEDKQVELLKHFSDTYYRELPWKDEKTPGLRYYYLNPSYSYSDGIFLFSMLRHVHPARVIEIGSGFTSALMMDTNELFFDNSIELTFIEPYPNLLNDVMTEEDMDRVKVVKDRMQDVPLSTFESLAEGDILFVDSTHVSKVGSDVNRIFFEILPALPGGVYIHFHDIFYPFELPKSWVYDGIYWNENYILHAFLEYNNQFEIVLFNTYMERFHREFFESSMPLCLKNEGGSIWLKKL